MNIVDSLNFCMAIPNLIAVYLLMPELRADLASYWQRVVLKSDPEKVKLSRKKYLWTLLAVYAVWWVVMAIKPLDRSDWLLENVLVVFAVALLVVTTSVSAVARLVHLHLRIPGAARARCALHLREGAVPGVAPVPRVAERNHFDRLVHFSYGLLLAYPIREMFLRIGNVRGFWGYFLPLDLTMSTSMLYELIEWGAAVAVGGDLGAAYLGTQGDIWDAHKDMALASLGALISMTVTALINRQLQRDFAREWAESIRVKRQEAARRRRPSYKSSGDGTLLQRVEPRLRQRIHAARLHHALLRLLHLLVVVAR